MTHLKEARILAVVNTSDQMEKLTNTLLNNGFARHDISIQDDETDALNQDGTINKSMSTRAVWTREDYVWLLGFIFALPVYIAVIAGLLVWGDVHLVVHNYLIIGAATLVGLVIGSFFAKMFHLRIKHRTKQHFAQHRKVIRVHAIGVSQVTKAKEILDKFCKKITTESVRMINVGEQY
jgi:hypothetical protein